MWIRDNVGLSKRPLQISQSFLEISDRVAQLTMSPSAVQWCRWLLYQIVPHARKGVSHSPHTAAPTNVIVPDTPAEDSGPGQRGPSWHGHRSSLQTILVAVAALPAAHHVHLAVSTNALLRSHRLPVLGPPRLHPSQLLVLQVMLFILQRQLQLCSRTLAPLAGQLQARVTARRVDRIARVVDVQGPEEGKAISLTDQMLSPAETRDKLKLTEPCAIDWTGDKRCHGRGR